MKTHPLPTDMDKNIIFIGMPGCGKTTLAQMVAQRLGRPWYDSDQEIEREKNMSIAEIFARQGEDYFREQETECILRLTEKKQAVISLGGGAVLKNSRLIKKNAVVIYIYRSIENILSTLQAETRPLLKEDAGKLFDLYEARHELYEQTCDIIIFNEKDMEDTLQKILEALP